MSCSEIMFRFLQSTVHRCQALVYFMEVVFNDENSPEEAIKLFEYNVLEDRSKRITEDICMKLTFKLLGSEKSHQIKR